MTQSHQPIWAGWLLKIAKFLALLAVVCMLGVFFFMRLITYDGYMSYASTILSDGINRMILLGHKGEGLPISSAFERCREEDVKFGTSPHLYDKCRVAGTLGSTGYNGLCFMWWLYDYCTGVAIEPWVVESVKEKFLRNPCEYMAEPLFCKYNFHIIAIDLTGLKVKFFEYAEVAPSHMKKQNPTLCHRFR